MVDKPNSKSALEEQLSFLDGLAAYKAHQLKDEEKRQVNVRLQLGELELLDALADHYDESRTSMAANLLSASITDAVRISGLNPDKIWRLAAEQKGKLE